jgi:DNA-binding GntR family transcriptional regulator
MDEVRAGIGRAPRLNEQVSEALRARISAGELPPGARLSESAVAAELGVSRTPVRSALRLLEEEGLLSAASGRGGYSVLGSGNEKDLSQRRDPGGVVPLTNSATWEGIYKEVSKKAVARAAYGSWRIIETELAASFGVSRTVVREVLARLEHVGIIRKDERSRWFLPALTHTRIRQLYEMRRILEPLALRDAARLAPRTLLEEMRVELEMVISAPEMAPPSEFDRLEQRLHVGLLSHGDNQVLLETLQHYHALLVTNAQLYDATRSAFGADPFVGEHLEIVTTLMSGKVELAVEQMEHHLLVALDRALDRIDYMIANKRFDPLNYLRPLDDQ